MSEANQEVTKEQVQNVTDLTSFNAYAFITLSDGQSVGVQITGRHGIPAERMYEDFKAFASFLDMCATDHAVKFVDKRNGTYPNEAQNGAKSVSIAPNGANTSKSDSKRDWKKPLPASEVPAELTDLNEDVYGVEFDYFVVEPKPEGKSVVKFFKDGLEFPVGAQMNQWKHETIKEALAQLTEKEINPKEAEKYHIAGIQYFVLGSEYTIQQGAHKGEKARYKNLKLLKPAL